MNKRILISIPDKKESIEMIEAIADARKTSLKTSFEMLYILISSINHQQKYGTERLRIS